MERVRHHIGGKPHGGAADRTGDVFDPALGTVARQVMFASEGDVDIAVATAKDAFPQWRDTPVTRRQRILFAYRELVEQHRDELAKLVVAEHGKTLDDARGEVSRGLEVIEFACAIPHLLKGSYSENVSTNVDTYSIRQPLGVVAGITPFNFPVMVPLWMFPMAIAAGNSFILKPSEKDPSPSVLAAELFQQAGLPDGVLNVVHGDRQAVERIVTHPDVAAISFVGSTSVAREVYRQGTAHGKRVQALAGAKNHMVVLADADMALAADSAVSAGYGSAGERCMAISVVVAVGAAADRLVPEINQRIAQLKIGAGSDPDSEMGPLITGEHRDRVRGYIDGGVAAGATIVADGRTFTLNSNDKRNGGHSSGEGGFFLGATLFDHVTTDMKIYQDEIFGPVLSVIRVDDFGAAIDLINANPWGNGTAIFTNDGGAARKFQNEIQVGMVGINLPIPVPLGFYSFGGWKQSIFGDHSIYGPEAINFYTRPKVMISRWSDPTHRGVELGFRPRNS